MKNLLLALIFITGIQVSVYAQQIKTLKKTIELVMPEGEGSNGACVAYHPVQKKYYASFAGNAVYPMAVFDIKGKRISTDSLKAGFDVRGLWYNSATNTLQGNGYNDFGWTSFSLNKSGIPTGNKVFVKEMSQPNEQSVGSFDDKRKVVYFLSGNKIVTYDLKGKQQSETKLAIEEEEEIGEEDSDTLTEKYNSTSLIYTGIAKAAWGLLNIESKAVVLFDKATGALTQRWTIDSDADFSSSFGFAYANGIVFIFNKTTRTWIGYK